MERELTKDALPAFPTVTVITPSYNQAAFIGECLESVRQQSYSALEHLVFDPGSSDGSREIVKKYDHAMLIAQPDAGQADAVAKGMRAAKGEIIGWLNSDDTYAGEQVLAKVSQRFQEEDTPDIVYGRGFYVDADGGYLRDAYINESPETLVWRLHQEVGILQPALFMRRRVIEEIGVVSPDLRFCMDYEYWLRAAQAGLRFAYIPEVLARARYYPSNKTFGQRAASYREICDTLKDRLGYVPVAWLKRYAECTVEGFDGILENAAQVEARRPEVLQQEVVRLLRAYDADHRTLQLLERQRALEPYRTTLEAMTGAGLTRQRPAHPIALEQTTVPRSACYTVGDQRWAFDRRWLDDQLQHTRRLFSALGAQRQTDTCVIAGNGPSLNQTDIPLLKGRDLLVANYAFLNQELFRHAKYLAVTNYLVAEQASHRFNLLRDIYKLFPYWLGYCLNSGPETLFFKAVGYPEFSTNVHRNVSWRSTVSFFLLQIAYGLGYRRALLIGFDHSYQQQPDVREGEILRCEGDDLNHFDRSYFKGKRWQAADVDNMETMYRLAKEAYEADGREIVNCTTGGHLELFRRGDLAAELGQSEVRAARLEEELPRVLVVSKTRLGSRTATGALLKTLFAGWPADRLAQVHDDAGPADTTACKNDFRMQDEADLEWAVARACVFAPELVYYRPVAEAPLQLDLVERLLRELRVPLVNHIMDDWPTRLQQNDPEAFSEVEPRLRALFDAAAVNLGIGRQMSEAFALRYGVGFLAVRNGVDPNEWPDAKDGYERDDGRAFVLRYSGSLAEDMQRQSVIDTARAVAVLRGRDDIRLDIHTRKHWQEQTPELSGIPGVLFREPVPPEAYRSMLQSADLLLLPVNFDEDSLSYVRYSVANKLPEYMASGTPILAYGPGNAATIGYIQELGCAQVVDTRDPQRLQAAILELVRDPDLRERLGRSARRLVFDRHNLRDVRREFRARLRRAADSGAEHVDLWERLDWPRESKASLDEVTLLARWWQRQSWRPVMLDVGAHQGGAAAPFLAEGWIVHAFEPDPQLCRALRQRLGVNPRLRIVERAVSNADREDVPFFTTAESTGAGTLAPFLPSHVERRLVDTTTLDAYCHEAGIDRVDFLKVDVEGLDLQVLEGFPWDRMTPPVVLCEFDERKTVPRGYGFRELGDFLVRRGYTVYVSEWHPVVRYGIRHDWARLAPYPCDLKDSAAWGNLIAFASPPDSEELARLAVEELIAAGRPPRVSVPTTSQPSSLVAGYEIKQVGHSTVRDYTRYFVDHPELVGDLGDLGDVQRPWALEQVQEYLPKGARVLDLGGQGPLLANRLGREFEVTLVDTAPAKQRPIRELLRRLRRPDTVRRVSDLFTELRQNTGRYDAIVSTGLIQQLRPEQTRELLVLMDSALALGGFSIHAIGATITGQRRAQELTDQILGELLSFYGASVTTAELRDRLRRDPEAYYLSPRMYQQWRRQRSFADYPWRQVGSINIVLEKVSEREQ